MGDTVSSLPRAVLAPSLVASSLADSSCLEVLELWREGRLLPVTSPGLVRRYLGVLSSLGVPRPLLRRWAWWFTSPQKCFWVDLPDHPVQTFPDFCRQVAKETGVKLFIHSGRLVPCPAPPVPGTGILWMSAAEYLVLKKGDTGPVS